MDQITTAIATLTRAQEGMASNVQDARAKWVEAVAAGAAEERDLYVDLSFYSGRLAGIGYALGELRAIAEGH